MDINPLPFPPQNENWHLSVSICFTSCSCDLISAANKPSHPELHLQPYVSFMLWLGWVPPCCTLEQSVQSWFCVYMWLYRYDTYGIEAHSRNLQLAQRHRLLYFTSIKVQFKPIFTSVCFYCVYIFMVWLSQVLRARFSPDLRDLAKAAGPATWE